MDNSQNIGKEIYDGSAKLGRIVTLILAIFLTILGIASFVVGILILNNHDKWTEIQGTLAGINYSPTGQCAVISNKYNCYLSFKYTLNGQSQMVSVKYTGSEPYYVGQVVSLYFKDNNFATFALDAPVPRSRGWLYIVFGIILVVVGWLWYHITKKNKVLAAGQGASAVLNMFR